MEIGADKLPRVLQVLAGLALSGVAVAWALSGLACGLAAALALAWHGGSVGFYAYLLSQLACALLGAPLMVRLALYLQRPHAIAPLSVSSSRRLAALFALATALSLGAAAAASLGG